MVGISANSAATPGDETLGIAVMAREKPENMRAARLAARNLPTFYAQLVIPHKDKVGIRLHHCN